MRYRELALTLLFASLVPAQDRHGDGQSRVLFLTHSAGYTHGVVKRGDGGELAYAEQQLLANTASQFQVDVTQDCGTINAKTLSKYAAVIFYTTGELPISESQKSALLDYVRQGGGFVGVHCATDTFYEWAEYGEMIGGYFDGHPWHQEVRVKVESPEHPSVAHLEDGFAHYDEIYQQRNWSRENKQVLLSLDPESVDISKGKREDGDYALAWCREYGEGRVFYTALGHGEEAWKEARFLRHLNAGIRWAMDAEEGWSRAPEGAVVLLADNEPTEWTHLDGRDCEWDAVDGALQVKPGTGNIVSRETFTDFRLHLEFRLPLMAEAKGQARANSGLYLLSSYELQILDSYGLESQLGDCGAIYGKRLPDVNACLAPEVWQSYDVIFRAARFDEAGKKTENARLTAFLNGVLIHEDVEVDGTTGSGQPEQASGPIMLQDHGNLMRFRRVWVLPL
ncbi:MAG: ThuA domain-containing protein [Planctomycetota bacterium]|jgi:type 1 glutamine amidotransferase